MDNGKTYWYDADSETWEGYAGGGSALGALSDVTITSPAAGEILAYNGSKWINSLSYSETSGATLTLYVDGTSGSDSNDGLTSDTAFATISKALAVPDNRYKIINVSGTLTESINVDGANAKITFSSGTIDLTISRTNNVYCNLALVNSTATVTLAFSGTWITGNLIIWGTSGHEITVNGLPAFQNSYIYLAYCNVTLSSSLVTVTSNLRVSSSNFTMGGYDINPMASNYYFDTVTLAGCGTNLFNASRGLLASLITLTHDATNLLRGTAIINYANITGSISTLTYGTSLIV